MKADKINWNMIRKMKFKLDQNLLTNGDRCIHISNKKTHLEFYLETVREVHEYDDSITLCFRDIHVSIGPKKKIGVYFAPKGEDYGQLFLDNGGEE